MVKLNVSSGTKQLVPQDIVSDAISASMMLEDMRAADFECQELDVCVQNMLFVQDVITEQGLEGLQMIDQDGTIEKFIGNVSTAEAAIEGLGEKIKEGLVKMVTTIKEWLKKVWDWIKGVVKTAVDFLFRKEDKHKARIENIKKRLHDKK